MSGEGWLRRGDRPRHIADFDAMPWQDFEAFALDVLRAHYEPQGILLRSTGSGPDGGRDAEAKFSIGTIEALAVELLLWVEVKHHNSPVGRKSTGSHLVAAINATANILVIVSSSGFSAAFAKEVELFSFRAGIRTVLVDAQTLLEIAEDAALRVAVDRNNPGARNVSKPSLSIQEIGFGLSSSLAIGKGRSHLLIDTETPVFVAVGFAFRFGFGCHDFQLELTTHQSGIQFVPLTAEPISKASPGERLTRLFLVKGAQGALISSTDIVCRAVSTPGCAAPFEVLGTPEFEAGGPAGCVEFLAPTVAFSPTKDQRDALARIGRMFQAWREAGGVASFSIEAAAGVGKSAIVTRARWLWLQGEVRELLVDGAAENNVWALFSAILAHLLPTEGQLAATFGVDAVKQWFKALATPPDVAARLARSVCAKDAREAEFTPGELTDVLAAMLRRFALTQPAVLVFEDLHKAGGSVLRLVHAARERLRLERGVPIVFCFTSRFATEGVFGESGEEAWRGERERLLGDENNRRFRLDVPSPADARSILTSSVPHLYPEVADDMISRVGTTPFALGELLRYLIERGRIERDPNGCLRLNLADELRTELKSADLVSRTATDQRLALLAQRLPTRSTDFISAAACLGREFDAEAINQRIGDEPATPIELEGLLGLLLREGVLEPTRRSVGGSWRFGHDIIREAVLQRLASPEFRPRHFTLIRRLLAHADWSGTVEMCLAFQAGHAERFLHLADDAARRLGEAGYFYEAANHLALENQILDPAAPTLMSENAIYRVFPRPSLDSPALPERLIGVKRRLFETLALVTGGADDTAKRLITDLRMLAERLRDQRSAALAEHWEGNVGIAVGDNEAAIARYEAAEQLFRNAKAGPDDLFPTILGKGIALRLVGRADASAVELERALSLDPQNARYQVRYHANYGALFFYSDPDRRREHWEQALATARDADLEDLAVHMDLDVASLDILDQRAGALERVERLIARTSERHFEDQLMRALVMASAVDLAEGDAASALARLDEARRVGYANDARRRLWKVHMNSATAHELNGNGDLCNHEQEMMLKVLKAVSWERRIALGPANIVLRAREAGADSTPHTLIERIPVEARDAVGKIVEAVETSRPATGRFPLEHLRHLSCGRRFIAV